MRLLLERLYSTNATSTFATSRMYNGTMSYQADIALADECGEKYAEKYGAAKRLSQNLLDYAFDRFDWQ